MKQFLIIFLASISILCFPINGQNAHLSMGLPVVFELGEFETDYEQLITSYQDLLLDACESDMYKAYDQWIDMLNKIEEFAQKNSIDIKGVKIWLNAFWNSDGQIEHFVFHLKPNSRNIDKLALANVLESFAKSYQLPLEHTNNFSHYGSAAFPTVLR